MSNTTKIEWCDSTFNPWTGCTKVSPGCDGCYAEGWSKRAGSKVGKWGPGAPRVRTSAANWKKPIQWNAQPFVECPFCGWRGEWADADERQGACPSCSRIPEVFMPARRRVFCASLADVFDNEAPESWRVDLFALIEETPNLDWLLLTKRIGNAAGMLPWSACSEPWANVWIGATIVNQEEADRDIPKLLTTPAAKRFLSMEPLLGPISFEGLFASPSNPADGTNALEALDWVIVGGESGPEARPMHPDWALSLRDQCTAACTPFLFKQWGEWKPICEGGGDWYDHLYRSIRVARDGEDQSTLDELWGRRCTVRNEVVHPDGSLHAITAPGAFQQGAMQTFRVGKKAAGRLLDGVEHNGFPICRPQDLRQQEHA